MTIVRDPEGVNTNTSDPRSSFRLVWPAIEYLPGYTHALEQGWSPDNTRPEAGREELARIRADPERFVAEQVDREARGGPIVLPDGSTVERLPGYKLWMWDGEFAGVVGFRWRPGTTELPPTCLGHLGYAVVPWKRRRGYATRALALALDEVRKEGLPFIEITTDEDNLASQRVIEANGGRVVERFRKVESYGGGHALRYRLSLQAE